MTAIYQDRGGVLWVGTKGGGLNNWNTHTGSFPHYRADPAAASGLSGNIVTSFFDEGNAVVWIGTFGGGLNRFDRTRGSFTLYQHEPTDPQSLSNDRVMSLLLDSKNILWVGTYGGGLNRFHRDTGTFTRYQHDSADPASLSRNGIMSIYEDRQGVLWIGTFEGGLDRMEPSSGTFIHYAHDPTQPTSLSNNRVTAFYEDAAGVLWIGTDGGGLNRFDRTTGTFAHYQNDPAVPTSLSNDSVLSIHEDGNGVLWIGTLGGGLNRWERAARESVRGEFQRYSERDGLPNDSIYGILTDDEGNLWLSTNQGLSKFDPGRETFRNYNTTHGLQSNEFNVGAYHRSADGEMFFGGVSGFNAFYPASIRDNAHVPPVVLTSFLKFNEKVDLGKPIWETDRVELGYRDYVVSFEFSALDYTAPEENRYAYMLEGFDEDWIELGRLRRATYTNLDAGDYLLRVKGSNNDGVWNEAGATLELRVIPPPWQTWWAYSFYGLLAVGVLFGYARAQARKLEREETYSRELVQQVDERTRELAERNEDLQEANQKLEEATLTDSMTGLRNRRYLMTHIHEDLALVERQYLVLQADAGSQTPQPPDFLFLMIDLDGFKRINDIHGHAAGDRALLQMRDILEKTCRVSDTIIRWGGDEVMVVGRAVNRSSAETVAERIRTAVTEHAFELGNDDKVRLGCSIGFAFYPFLPSAPSRIKGEQAMKIADRALYLAKQSGRNAWVGIYATDKTPGEDLIPSVNDRLEEMSLRGEIELSTSITDPTTLCWSRAS